MRLIVLALLAALTMAASAQKTPCELKHWTWRNSSVGVKIEGVVTGDKAKVVYIQVFDKNKNFLGNGEGYLDPLGGFTIFIDKQNPTKELRIKYGCG